MASGWRGRMVSGATSVKIAPGSIGRARRGRCGAMARSSRVLAWSGWLRRPSGGGPKGHVEDRSGWSVLSALQAISSDNQARVLAGLLGSWSEIFRLVFHLAGRPWGIAEEAVKGAAR